MSVRVPVSCLLLALLAGCPAETGAVDAGSADAGSVDGGPIDAGPVDAGPVDAGPVDAGPVDAGPVDADPVDAGPVDAEPVDGGAGDTGATDAGPPSAAALAYWQSTGAGLTGQALVDALHAKLAATHVRVAYADVLEAFESTDVGRAGCAGVFDFYSARCWSPAQSCGNYDEEGDCYNREHSWPKSWFSGGESSPAYSDLFHVVPADGYVNNQRGNFPFGEVTTASYTSSNGSRVGTCAAPEAGGDCFEPTDELKGDLARAYFYMAVRYEGELGCCEAAAVDGADLKPWTEVILRAWHEADPVDDDERRRNEAVFALQQNRNPFVDFPSWVGAIADF